MAIPISLSQASLAAVILGSVYGNYVALSPPNPSHHVAPSTGDSVRGLLLTKKHSTKVALAPWGLLALQSAALAWRYPDIPASVVRHGAKNGLNTNLITWSPATVIPLALIFGAGIPLRLIPYASLGKNFTFALKKPDRLKTTGIYQYVQHPSYTGLLILMFSNAALLGRLDGPITCWIPPQFFNVLYWTWGFIAPCASLVVYGISKRVYEEEKMLKGAFGKEWENWHAKTARFIPYIF
ncbi:isoprenylcysteine carboxyl methyltransferase [Fusarium sporotrichioides]|uniref:Protein-S-isoprenylcysteine O-methyltransferase n=1 Tax=Fusarium sporotrichioides TaxID=5514 RepID=A0A395RN74_FUSSP|nr:isoprenylcysteine carboxyl methyltransferase [Fusarium sporotrichioides]